MPVNPNIALGGIAPQMPNMLANYAQAQDIGVNQMKMDEYKRGLQEQNALRDLIKTGVDLKSPEARKKMYEISPEMGMKFEKSQAELEKAGLETKKLGGDIAKQSFEQEQRIFSKLAVDPSDKNILEELNNQIKSKAITPEQAQGMWTQVSKLDSKQRSAVLGKLAMDAEKRATIETTRRGQDLTYAAATQPVFSESAGGFFTRPTGGKESTFVKPAGMENTKKGAETEKGKGLVADVATQMGDSYLKLQQAGGIKSTQKGAAANIAAGAQSSMAGQFGGAVLGTPEQAERDFIKSQRPLLVQAIVKATGMSATQINSNAELKNLLDAATDPSKGYETNAKSLNLINKRFGTGADVIPVNTGGGSNIDALLKKYE